MQELNLKVSTQLRGGPAFGCSDWSDGCFLFHVEGRKERGVESVWICQPRREGEVGSEMRI